MRLRVSTFKILEAIVTPPACHNSLWSEDWHLLIQLLTSEKSITVHELDLFDCFSSSSDIKVETITICVVSYGMK